MKTNNISEEEIERLKTINDIIKYINIIIETNYKKGLTDLFKVVYNEVGSDNITGIGEVDLDKIYNKKEKLIEEMPLLKGTKEALDNLTNVKK